MKWLKSFRYAIYALLDRILGLAGYLEAVVAFRDSAIRSLECYVSHLIEYFEEIPFLGAEEKNKEKLNAMGRLLDQANSFLVEIHGFPRKRLNDIERDLFCVMMGGSDFYALRGDRLCAPKSIFDAKSVEIKHLLYMMHGGEVFMFRDLFIKAKVVKGRIVFELDRDIIESRKLHEYEFSDDVREKVRTSKLSEK
ncbi:MAG TPA: hypothetical protein PK590_05130 [Candidatus Omnitrophota bacterium]|nr:hypothetical protein [Candidatus Omnitrophota bacterium]